MKKTSDRLDRGLKTLNRPTVLMLIAVFLLGSFSIFGLRYILVDKKSAHYHANFALFVNGERDEFKSFTYYEEINACSGSELNNPHTRVHLHDQINHVVHVHDPASTWGHLFANLGYTLGNNVLATNQGEYVDGNGGLLRFILNGKEVSAIANQTIASEDVLLVNYGNENTGVLQSRYDSISKDAEQYNKRTDPSSCTGGKPETLYERFRRTVGLGTYN